MGKLGVAVLILIGIIMLILFVIFHEIKKPNSRLFRFLVNQERKDFNKKQKKKEKVQSISRRVVLEEYENFNIFYPKMFLGREKIIISLYGGSFITGNKDSNNVFNSFLSEQGCIVISVQYPLAPENKISDMLQAISNHIDEAISQLSKKVDIVEKIHLIGNGAGALLALYLAAASRSSQISRLFEVSPSKYKIQSLVLISGAFQTIKKDEKKNVFANQIWGFDWKTKYGEFTQTDFLVHHCELPPLYIFTSSKDSNRGGCERLYKSCINAGKNARLKKYKNEELCHSFAIEHPELEESQDLLDRVSMFTCN
ncbi:MAG: alpha/beta hydrolase fold domain-containing protein [Bacillota bacterium]|nr:alpha/beta hydrolase fold domain-containing protein [Bacillota bacterium]